MAKPATPKSRARRKAQPLDDTRPEGTEPALAVTPDTGPDHGRDGADDPLPAPLGDATVQSTPAAGADETDARAIAADTGPVAQPISPQGTADAPALPGAVEGGGAAPDPAAEPGPAESPVAAPPADPEPATRVQAAPSVPVDAAPSRGVLWPALGALGGAAAGAVAIWFSVPFLSSAPAPDLAALERRLDAIDARLSAPVATLGADEMSALLAPIAARLAAIESTPPPDFAGIESRLSVLTARIEGIEQGLAGQIRDSVAVTLAETVAETFADGQMAADAAARARAAELADAAAALAAAEVRIVRRAALAELAGAALTGTPAPQALAALGEVPDTLRPMAQGLPTLAMLQASYPAAARAALAALPPPVDAPLGDRLVGFLRTQTGARSLAPRDGDDPDAVLSRAEAALRAGNLRLVLDELDLLPEPAASAMAGWRGQAEQRADALDALDALRAELD